jgi:hypothetical protein
VEGPGFGGVIGCAAVQVVDWEDEGCVRAGGVSGDIGVVGDGVRKGGNGKIGGKGRLLYCALTSSASSG